MSIKRFLIGDTVEVSWINSGITPSAIHYAAYNGSETLVDSASMTSSGNGHYFGLHTVPNTPGFYVVYTTATIAGKPFRRAAKYEAVTYEVD